MLLSRNGPAPSLVLFADRLEHSEEGLEDIDNDRDHSSLDNPLADVFSPPDADVDHTLEGEGPFEAVLSIVDLCVLEDPDEPLQAAVSCNEITDCGCGAGEVGEVGEGIDHGDVICAVEGTPIVYGACDTDGGSVLVGE